MNNLGKAIIIAVSCFIFINGVRAEQTTDKSNQEREIYYLYKNNSNIIKGICTYSEGVNLDDPCDVSSLFPLPPDGIEGWEVDLNNDGNPDYILADIMSRIGPGEVIHYVILLARDAKTFYEAGNILATDISLTKMTENGFSVLLNHSICYVGDVVGIFERWAYIKYDNKTQAYKTELEITHDNGFVTPICGLDTWPEYMQTRIPPGNEKVKTSPTASFDCKKAKTQVEKMICDNDEIVRLDMFLDANFKAVKGVVIDSEKDKLLNDQKSWIKQRNTCKSVKCLSEIYRERIDGLCTDYSTIPGKPFTCHRIY
jgi:hypothetical protein